MAIIDIKLKSYDELIFEITKLNIDKYLLEKENKQLKEQLENKIDLYEDTISYQLGFDKGKEYMQQRIDKAIDWCNEIIRTFCEDDKQVVVAYKIKEILGDKE